MGLEGYKRPLEWLLLLCWRDREATRKLYEQKSESLSILKTINNSGCTAENGVVGTKSEIKEKKQGAVLLTQARHDSFLNRSKVNQPMTFRYKERGRWKDCLWNFYITEIMAGIVIQNETVIQVIHFEEMRESRPEDCRDLLQEWGVNSLMYKHSCWKLLGKVELSVLFPPLLLSVLCQEVLWLPRFPPLLSLYKDSSV